MVMVVETFDPVTITDISVQFMQDDGTKSPGTKFGAAGTVGGETLLRQIIKREEGIEVAKRTKAEKMTLTVSAHVKLKVLRDIFGFSNTDLKPGIYSYGTDSKAKRFTLTANAIDEFEDVTKLMAFPDCISATGFTFNIENGADEVALMEISLEAYPDDFKQILYEAMVEELEDQTIPTTWHTQFDRTLVEVVPTP
ncbi:phage tail protein [Radiobacillus kanasensis]|uniref:phage tail protein n=1 Tax=Radiobacillus kanasensis TaxID=2844358 RepID=UPI001E35EB3A|nr:phage tail protein [Radiobacillus kanasensis]UFU00369.1 phage tail protein [Radiobacillus kanasensis]